MAACLLAQYGNGSKCHLETHSLLTLRKGHRVTAQMDKATFVCSRRTTSRQAKWESARTAEESQTYLLQRMKHLRIYTNIVSELYHAKRHNEKGDGHDKRKCKLSGVTEWMQSRVELPLWCKGMVERPQLALRVSRLKLYNEKEEKSVARLFSERGRAGRCWRATPCSR